MKLAVLFWFYKQPEVCENRVKLIKQFNADLQIFGLYGGLDEDLEIFKEKLGPYLVDFYVTSYQRKESRWKWINGDLMLLDWYMKRGKQLTWDSVVVIQWDALVLGPLKVQFPRLKKDQMFLSGLRPLDNQIERRWFWTREGSKERKNYVHFKEHIFKRYGYEGKLWCCLFILQILPRTFFEAWSRVRGGEIGMLEYKIPTYAKIFKTPLYKRHLGVGWFDTKKGAEEIALHAWALEIKKCFIKSEARKRNGFRIFHPYSEIW